MISKAFYLLSTLPAQAGSLTLAQPEGRDRTDQDAQTARDRRPRPAGHLQREAGDSQSTCNSHPGTRQPSACTGGADALGPRDRGIGHSEADRSVARSSIASWTRTRGHDAAAHTDLSCPPSSVPQMTQVTRAPQPEPVGPVQLITDEASAPMGGAAVADERRSGRGHPRYSCFGPILPPTVRRQRRRRPTPRSFWRLPVSSALSAAVRRLMGTMAAIGSRYRTMTTGWPSSITDSRSRAKDFRAFDAFVVFMRSRA